MQNIHSYNLYYDDHPCNPLKLENTLFDIFNLDKTIQIWLRKVFMASGSAFTIIVITNGNRCSTTVAAVFHFMAYLKTFKIGKVNEVLR